MAQQRNKPQRRSTLREKLAAYFALVMGTAVLFSLFSMMFCLAYNQRNASLIEHMANLHDYYDQLDLAQSALGKYVRYEDEGDYDEAMACLAAMRTEFTGGTEGLSLAFSREKYDVVCMTETFADCARTVHAQMLAYQAAGRVDFSHVTQAHNEAIAVHSAIRKAYAPLNDMLLEMIKESHEAMKRQLALFIAFLALMIVAACLLMAANTRRLARTLSVPINALTDAARKIREGQMEAVEPLREVETDDEELKMLLSVFDEMTGKVKTQIQTLKENVRIRQELEESRLKELQMQINPHFMFNTLNMISETAYLENAEKTVFLLEKTAKMYRFSLDFSGKPVPLSREIEALGNYVIVQEERFGDRFRFLFDLDERFHHIMIPALTLQPLVENAIIHGVGLKMEEGYVLVQTRYDEAARVGRIIIEDNGEGMDEGALNALRESIEAGGANAFKIGLNNVMRRLKLQYGERVQMHVHSGRGQGTRIAIEIRLSEEETACIG